MIALARTVEARDLYTERHLHRVANRAVAVATRLGVIGPAIETVRLGGCSTTSARSASPTECSSSPLH